MHSLTLALDRGEWSVSCPGSLYPQERAPGTHWIGGSAGPRDGLDAVVKDTIHKKTEYPEMHLQTEFNMKMVLKKERMKMDKGGWECDSDMVIWKGVKAYKKDKYESLFILSCREHLLLPFACSSSKSWNLSNAGTVFPSQKLASSSFVQYGELPFLLFSPATS